VAFKLLIVVYYAVVSAIAQTGVQPAKLRCEALENPLGIDALRPRLSWQMESRARDARQAAFEVLVSTRLDISKPDVWDSGRIDSQAEGIDYAGPALDSARRYYWTVRIWPRSGGPVVAKPAWWEMGLLSPSDWKAQWIAWHDQEDLDDRAAGVKWMWLPGEKLEAGKKLTRYFRYQLLNDQEVRDAVLLVAAREKFHVSVNGRKAGKGDSWGGFRRLPLDLDKGGNTIVIEVTSNGTSGGVAALLKFEGTRVASPASWEVATDPVGPWQAAAVLGDAPGPWPPRPVASLRKEIFIPKDIRTARLRATALGSYQMFINGSRVGDDLLTPDWTDYRKRVLYQTYDVTSKLEHATNRLEALLGYGWYGSALGWTGARFNFGPPPPRLLAQLELTYTDGSREVFGTDGSWEAAESAIRYSEIYGGESYDGSKEPPATWMKAEIMPPPGAVVGAQMSPPIRGTSALGVEKISEPKPGVRVYDMGQNMVGLVLVLTGGDNTLGHAVRLRFAERLDTDGNIYTDNLRGAEATDTYIGGEIDSFLPHFTYHGFRYVEVTGLAKAASITGLEFHTEVPITGAFDSGSEIVNQIFKNTMWGQRGNLMSVPTDCPQRDERLGWMGDAGIFWRTATYNMDMQAFTHKWMHDVVDAQSPAGGFPDVAPRVIDERDGAPAWGDAGVIVPWTAYRQYGDRRIVEENWDAMGRWMNYIHEPNPGLIWTNRRNNDFGDWVPANSTTPKDLIATAYWAQDAKMMADMAHGIHREADAAKYAQLFNGIHDAFIKKFVREDGTIGNGSQTCYALALHIGLVPEALRKAAVGHLVADIEKRDWHLSTGFLGTPHLMFALSENGRADVAYKLLLNETYPSWGYQIRKGATTIWERWNGDTGDPSMNSYNHYAFGSVVEWLYREMAGIDTDGAAPGFEKIVIHPHPDARVGHVKAEYDSVRGKIVSEWSLAGDGAVSLNVTIPANTTATVVLPGVAGKRVSRDGRAVAVRASADGAVSVEVGSGTYKFRVE
jgi:alpha-L-rhamnosidase